MHPDLPPPSAVLAGGLRWRVQRTGPPASASAPTLLLLHGTGSSLLSWQGCLPALAAQFQLVVPDLPGHGGTDAFADRSASLPRMAQAVGALLRALGLSPALAAGHSAGAAVMVQLALDGGLPAARGLLAVNGALEPLPGLMGLVAPAVARMASRSVLLPDWVTRHAAQPRALGHLIASTGSRLDDAGVAHYRDLLRQPDHVRGVLDMLAVTDFPDIRRKAAIQSSTEGNILLIPREGGYLVRLYVDLGDVAPDNREAALRLIPIYTAATSSAWRASTPDSAMRPPGFTFDASIDAISFKIGRAHV